MEEISSSSTRVFSTVSTQRNVIIGDEVSGDDMEEISIDIPAAGTAQQHPHAQVDCADLMFCRTQFHKEMFSLCMGNGRRWIDTLSTNFRSIIPLLMIWFMPLAALVVEFACRLSLTVKTPRVSVLTVVVIMAVMEMGRIWVTAHINRSPQTQVGDAFNFLTILMVINMCLRMISWMIWVSRDMLSVYWTLILVLPLDLLTFYRCFRWVDDHLYKTWVKRKMRQTSSS